MNAKIPNLYITMWLLYYLQGVLYNVGGFLSQSLLVILLIASLYYFVYSIFKYSLPKPLRILSVMIVAWTLYGLVSILSGTGFEYLKSIYISLLPIYAFYVFVKKGFLSEDTIRRWLVIFILVAISSFYKRQNEMIKGAADVGMSPEGFTNGTGYILVGVLPLLPLVWRKPVRQFLMLGVCMLYVLMGFKRGAIISGTLCSLWLIYNSFKSERGSNGKVSRRRMSILILTLVFIVGAIFVVQYFLSTNDYFNYRLESTRQGDSSNRNNLYGFFLSYFINDMSPLDYLFGLGANGTLKIYGNVAHNDWLEIAINNGAIMLLLYFFYWVSMIKMFIKGNNRNVSNIMFGMFVIIYLFRTFFSFSYGDIPIYSSCALGYATATYMPKNQRLYRDS